MNHHSALEEGGWRISLPAAEGMFFQRATLDYRLQEKSLCIFHIQQHESKRVVSGLTFFFILR